jgi:hypothetical protein
MSEDPKTIIKSIVETLYRQSFILEAMSSGISNTISLCLASLPKCCHEECENSTTWKSKDSAKFICDRHLAEDIVKKNQSQDSWEEVPAVDNIRVLADYAEIRKNAFEMTVN